MKRGNNGKLSVAQCCHLLNLPPHYSQRVRVEDQNIPGLPVSSSLCRPGLPQSRSRSVPRRTGAERVTPLSAGSVSVWHAAETPAWSSTWCGAAPQLTLFNQENGVFKAVHGKGMAAHSPTCPAMRAGAVHPPNWKVVLRTLPTAAREGVYEFRGQSLWPQVWLV